MRPTSLANKTTFHAALEAYNQKVKDAMMLYFTMPELAQLGILKHLKLDGFLGASRKVRRA